MNTVTLKNVLKSSLTTFKKHYLKIMGLGLILCLPTIPQTMLGITFEGPFAVIDLFLALVQVFLTTAANLYFLNLIRSNEASFKVFIDVKTLKIFPRVLGQYLLILLCLLPFIALFIGSLLYISQAATGEVFSIPTSMTTMVLATTLFVVSLTLITFLGVALVMSSYLALENKNIIQNLKNSWKISQGHRLKLFAIILFFSVLGALVNASSIYLGIFFAFLPSFISILIIFPFMSLTLVSYYDQLTKFSERGEELCQK